MRNLLRRFVLKYVVQVKSTVEISQNCLAFSEYINFIWFQNSTYSKRTNLSSVVRLGLYYFRFSNSIKRLTSNKYGCLILPLNLSHIPMKQMFCCFSRQNKQGWLKIRENSQFEIVNSWKHAVSKFSSCKKWNKTIVC